MAFSRVFCKHLRKINICYQYLTDKMVFILYKYDIPVSGRKKFWNQNERLPAQSKWVELYKLDELPSFTYAWHIKESCKFDCIANIHLYIFAQLRLMHNCVHSWGRYGGNWNVRFIYKPKCQKYDSWRYHWYLSLGMAGVVQILHNEQDKHLLVFENYSCAVWSQLSTVTSLRIEMLAITFIISCHTYICMVGRLGRLNKFDTRTFSFSSIQYLVSWILFLIFRLHWFDRKVS